MPAPSVILDLVARFEQQRDSYQSGAYNETQLRRDFLDPLFQALGWDMVNAAGYAEAYRDVIHEDALRIGAAVKAPDYSFRVGGNRKFFLEAKKPSVDLRADSSPAHQLRRYAWSAKLPLSILSNFEELAVYDGRFKPLKDHPASTARVFYCTFRELPEKWDWLDSIFSRDAVLKGSFDRYAETNKTKRGTAEVDADFLASMETWRHDLARNLALRNPRLAQRELNFAVQRILDRIIFLRICEDRGLENYGRLLALTNGGRIYPRLCQHFEQADTRYNSGLFHFQPEKGRRESPDELTLGLDLDDALLRDLLKGLYYPDSPYVFSVISADILGQVYEQFLGKVIRLTEGHRAVVDEKPEVRKAGGVYYTPTYIADYIVRQTVGKLVGEIAGRSAQRILDRVAQLRILDPACGSGSFLICAYQFLLDWHLQFYLANDPPRWAKGRKPALVQTSRGWRLTIAERKRILLDNLYGVDIDPQAVEVTKLSLLLKVLEGETSQTLAPLFSLFHERALPDLGDNIKCGNSLIGPDFYQQAELPLLTDEARLHLNVFDWHAEFPQIFRPRSSAGELRETATASPLDYTMPGVPLHGSYRRGNKKSEEARPTPAPMASEWEGGFDAVIGNPPYVRIQTMQETQPEAAAYLSRQYRSASKGNYDLYVVFVERALGLLNPSGINGFILPHKFFNSEYGEPLRTLLSAGRHLEHIVHFGADQVFTNATTYTCLLFLTKARSKRCRYHAVRSLKDWARSPSAGFDRGEIEAECVHGAAWNIYVGKGSALTGRLAGMVPRLGQAADIFVGLQTSADDVFILDLIKAGVKTFTLRSKAAKAEITLEKTLLHPLLSGTDVQGYNPLPLRQYILFPYAVTGETASLLPFAEIEKECPRTAEYLKTHRERLTKREGGKFRDTLWYRFGRSQNLGIQERAKVCVPRLVDRLCACLDEQGSHFLDNVDVGGVTFKPGFETHSLAYLCGLLNSRLLAWYFPKISAPFRGGWMSANRQFLCQVPFRRIDFANGSDRAQHDRMVLLVEQMLGLQRQLAAARTPHERTALERQIAATDAQIDRLVYDLYGLTADEVRIVENAGP